MRCNHADDVEKLVAASVEKFGQLNGLVNSAGVIMMDNAWDMSNEDMKQQFSVNVEGTFLCSRAVARHFRGNGGGSIVNVASKLRKGWLQEYGGIQCIQSSGN